MKYPDFVEQVISAIIVMWLILTGFGKVSHPFEVGLSLCIQSFPFFDVLVCVNAGSVYTGVDFCFLKDTQALIFVRHYVVF